MTTRQALEKQITEKQRLRDNAAREAEAWRKLNPIKADMAQRMVSGFDNDLTALQDQLDTLQKKGDK